MKQEVESKRSQIFKFWVARILRDYATGRIKLSVILILPKLKSPGCPVQWTSRNEFSEFPKKVLKCFIMSSDSNSDDDMIISYYYHRYRKKKQEDFAYTPTLRRISIIGYCCSQRIRGMLPAPSIFSDFRFENGLNRLYFVSTWLYTSFFICTPLLSLTISAVDLNPLFN